MFVGSKVQPEGRADNFTTICEPPKPITGIALFFITTLDFIYSPVIYFIYL
jgi:hypothetical protein